MIGLDSAQTAAAGPADLENDIGDDAIISPAIIDAFKSLQGQKVMLRSTKATRAMVAFNTIRLPYPRQLEAMLTFQEAQHLARSMMGKKQNAICLFARSHTGKTTAAEHYAHLANEAAPHGIKPVVLISLGSAGGACDMHRKILKALGEGYPGTKDLEVLRDRSCEAMSSAGTELIIIDEAHEGDSGSVYGPRLTSELKTLLNGGHVGIVLLGTERAEHLISKDEEFLMRTMAPCRLGALDWADLEDREMWIGLASALDEEMVRIGIVSEQAGLADEELAFALCQACAGVIGQLMKVVLHALRHAVYDDRDYITVEDLAIAVDEWSINLGFSETNPLDHLLDEAA